MGRASTTILRPLAASLVLLALAAVLGGCLADRAPSPAGEPVQGTVLGVSIDPSSGHSGTLLVKLPLPNAIGSDQAAFRVAADVPVVDDRTGTATSIALVAVQPGQVVQVEWSGPIAESYPVQVTATAVHVVADAAG